MSDEQAMREIDGIGVIARVSPEDKVHLVDILRKKGHVVAMTGDGVNDAPALKKADIGIAMGITGTEVSKQAAVMILTDDNYATIVKAVGLGRSVYDNLMRFIRFQMAGLFAFIATFLGSSLLNIMSGIPFLPLQTMWLNFTVNVFQAMGLGYGKPREGLMEVPPRPKEQQIMPRRLMTWLVFVGLVMAAGTLGVLAWADSNFGDVVARTMGVTTFALFRLFSSLETADEDESLFSGGILGNRPLLIGTGLSVLTILLATELGFLQRILGTVSLTPDQWAVCILVSLSLIVVEEARKLFRIRTGDEAVAPVTPAAPAVA
jgi:Ca2+-transporting ATPase